MTNDDIRTLVGRCSYLLHELAAAGDLESDEAGYWAVGWDFDCETGEPPRMKGHFANHLAESDDERLRLDRMRNVSSDILAPILEAEVEHARSHVEDTRRILSGLEAVRDRLRPFLDAWEPLPEYVETRARLLARLDSDVHSARSCLLMREADLEVLEALDVEGYRATKVAATLGEMAKLEAIGARMDDAVEKANAWLDGLYEQLRSVEIPTGARREGGE